MFALIFSAAELALAGFCGDDQLRLFCVLNSCCCLLMMSLERRRGRSLGNYSNYDGEITTKLFLEAAGSHSMTPNHKESSLWTSVLCSVFRFLVATEVIQDFSSVSGLGGYLLC